MQRFALDIPFAPFRHLGNGLARFVRAAGLIGHVNANKPVLFGIGHRVVGDHISHDVDLRLHGSLIGIGPIDCGMGTRAPVKHAPSLHFPIYFSG